MRVLEDAIADGIGDTRLADGRVPRGRRELAGDERRATLAPIFDHLQEISPLRLGERREQPIVDRDQIELGEFGEQPGIRAVASTDRELVEQPRGSDVCRREAVPARTLDEGRGQPRFPDPGRSRDQQIVVITDPAPRAEAEDRFAIQAARRREVDILERSRVPQLRVAEPLRQAPALACGPLGVDQQAESIFKREFGVLAGAPLLVKRLGHRRQAQGLELLDRRIRQHKPPRSRWRHARFRA